MSRGDGGEAVSYVADILGTTVALADGGGALATTYTYAPFGETSVAGPPSTSPVQYTGRENDGTGLYYYRARYYDPGRGRFIREDAFTVPLRLARLAARIESGGQNIALDTNLYGYAGGNPLVRVDPFGLDWIYSQSAGNLYRLTSGTNVEQKGSGYSGHGEGVNNPAMQDVSDTGPIPQGTWNIGPQRDSRKTGRGVMDLTPTADTNTFDRSGFQIHGDNSQGDQSASEGCIVLPRNLRDQISKSRDRRLRVVP